MKKILLFAIAASLSAVAFALNNVDCTVEENCHCNFFSQSQYYGIKGCAACPVVDANGQRVKCETVAENNNGVIDRDCCWLNTPKAPGRPAGHPWENCYTNAYRILDPSYGPPWAIHCVQLLNNLVNSGSQGGSQGGNNNGGNNNGGANAGNGTSKIVKSTFGQRPTTPNGKPVITGKNEKPTKQIPVQSSSKKVAK